MTASVGSSTVALGPPSQQPSNLVPVQPLLKIRLPFAHRLTCFLRLWLLKLVVSVFYRYDRLISNRPPRSIQPTLIKHYPSRPTLQVRIFFPPNYSSSSSSSSLLPTYFSIHGGGFAVGDPQQDDEFCTMWAARTGHLVISLDYRKAPFHPFPSAIHDIAALTESILSDPSLPIDLSRISIGGFSAGANLALCASQLPPLKTLVRAAVIYYPIVNWDHPPHEKLARRPYDPAIAPRDSLAEISYALDWGYVPPGTNRRDPRLSPYHADRRDLPPRIHMVVAEWDLLRLEAQVMIHELAGVNLENKGAGCPEDFETKDGRYKFSMARGCAHGFTHHIGLSAEGKRKCVESARRYFDEAAEWLRRASCDDADGGGGGGDWKLVEKI